MTIAESFQQELAYESGNTRRMLERVPMEKSDWTPHPKSMTLGRLASHVAETTEWVGYTVERDELVLDPGQYKPKIYASTDEMVLAFDAACTAAMEALQGRDDATMMRTWRLIVGGQAVMELPKIVVLKSMVLNHMIHHRGQLSVYLRMNNVPLPGLYGPTADEPMAG